MNIFLIVAVVLVVIIIGIYNSLIGRKNQVENAFASIDALLKKRYDLIPNLVSTVKNYMQHERGTLTEITELRAKATSGQLSSEDKIALENKLSRVYRGIMVAVENYPDLKASQNFLQLEKTLNEIEEQISAARRAYNASVTDFNNSVEMFPTSVFASMMNFKRKQLFEIPEAERQNVNVGDLFKK